jgi:hypothetical protein
MELEAQRDYDLAVAKETYGENSDEYFTESVKIQDAYNQAKDNLEK